MIVNLSVEEVRTCALIGVQRWLTKFGSIDRPNYAGPNKRFLEPEIAANTRTIVAEYAVAKLYKKPVTLAWYPNDEHAFRSQFADVEPCYEIKSVRTKDAIPVFPKDIRPGVVLVGVKVLDSDYYSQVEIYGWRLASECQKAEWHYKPENSWRVPLDEFDDSIPQW